MGIVKEEVQKPKGWGTRHTLVFLGFMSLGVSYAMRFSLSLAIVEMVDYKVPIDPNATNVPKEALTSCKELIQVKVPSNESEVEADEMDKIMPADKFSWTEKEQAMILGSFFYGYCITQIPGGMLAQRYSAKYVLGIGILISAIFTILSPPAAIYLGKESFMVCRFIEGLAGGSLVPSIQVILAKWLPPAERSGSVSLVFSGISVGTAITMVVTGFIIEYSGWPAVFYVIGVASILWVVAWWYYVYDNPNLHPRISPEEKEYIQSQLGPGTVKVNLPTPWLKIFTTVPILVIFLAQTTKVWGLYTLLNLLPKYFKTVLHFDIKQNALISASPQLCMLVIANVVTHFGDWLISSKRCSVLNVRKLCNTIAQWGCCLAMLGAAFSGCDRLIVLIFLNLAVGFMGAGFGGCLVNVIDIAPNFAGVIMGIGNTFGSMTGFAAPGIAGWILDGNVTQEQWKLVFFLAAGLLFTGNGLYILLAQTDEVPWNRPPPLTPSPSPTPEPGQEEEEEEDEFTQLPSYKPDSPPPAQRYHRRRSTLRRESQAFVPPFNPPAPGGRRYSTLSLGMPHAN